MSGYCPRNSISCVMDLRGMWELHHDALKSLGYDLNSGAKVQQIFDIRKFLNKKIIFLWQLQRKQPQG